MSKVGPGKQNPDGSTSLFIPDGVEIKGPNLVQEPSLSDERFDPFSEFKTDPDKYHYRALNIRPQNMRVRKAEGYETIAEAEFGDLVLGRVPLEVHNRRIAREEAKTKQQEKAAIERFKNEADNLGVKTFESE